ncbi:zf-RING-2 multi-domain protein [Pyrenophora teres f. maculata]|nr:zf-RING-2 multi-domain protein [Pyrenophora teres f. maculata]
MSTGLDDWAPPVSQPAPATAQVYEMVRLRLRNLRGLRKFEKEADRSRQALSMTPGELRKPEQQHFPFDTSKHPLRLADMSDEQVRQAAEAAQAWLFTMLDYHGRTMNRDQEMRLFRLAVEKEGRRDVLTDQEQLYMALSDPGLTSPEDRLKAGFMIVLHGNLAEKLQDVSEVASRRIQCLIHESYMDAGMMDAFDHIADRMEFIKVDHFACAIPLSLLTTIAGNTSVIDDNAGCCPICQNSYTDLSEFTVEELLADYPVRIKYCGHVVGKACLEQWMMTPKIDEAKYPHRTCPLCRVKIEGVETPAPPALLSLRNHLLADGRALKSLRKLMYEFGVHVEESIEAISACMSEEIACLELLAEVERRGGDDKEQKMVLKGRLDQLNQEKWVWGFKGDGVWKQLRDGWMNSTYS